MVTRRTLSGYDSKAVPTPRPDKPMGAGPGEPLQRRRLNVQAPPPMGGVPPAGPSLDINPGATPNPANVSEYLGEGTDPQMAQLLQALLRGRM